MFDGILEFILELILGGAAEEAGSKAVPLPIRVIFAAFLILFYLATFGLCHKTRKLRKRIKIKIR